MTNLKAGGMPGQVWRDPENELIMYGRSTAHADRRQHIQACKEKVFCHHLHFLFYAHDVTPFESKYVQQHLFCEHERLNLLYWHIFEKHFENINSILSYKAETISSLISFIYRNAYQGIYYKIVKYVR
jgi:hypothetical protein